MIFLSCGSNLGDRCANIERAIAALLAAGQVRLLRRSSYYKTSPVDYLDQPDFVNNVIEVETDLDLRSFWQRLDEIQKAANPPRANPKGPRVIDLDILLFGDLVIADDHLTIPHKSTCRRRFVLVPLLEIAPELKDPLTGKPYRDCLAELDADTQRVELYRA